MTSILSLPKGYCHSVANRFIVLFSALLLLTAIVSAQSPFPDGTVIADDTGPIWVIINGQKRWIKSPAIMVELGWDKVPLKKISPDVARRIPDGPDLNSAETGAKAILFRRFPIRASASRNIEGGTMESNVTISSNGQVTVITRTFTKVIAKGFTGGVYVVLFSDNGDGKISDIKTYGVDGTCCGRSDRTETFQFQVDSSFARQVTQVAIILEHSPRYADNLAAIVSGSKRFADAFVQIKKNLAPVIKDVVPSR